MERSRGMRRCLQVMGFRIELTYSITHVGRRDVGDRPRPQAFAFHLYLT